MARGSPVGLLADWPWLVDSDPSPSPWPSMTMASLKTPSTRPQARSARSRGRWTSGRGHPAHPPSGEGRKASGEGQQPVPRHGAHSSPLLPQGGSTAQADNRLSVIATGRGDGRRGRGRAGAPQRWWHNG